jgi:ferredoxin-NADP reductase
VEGTTLPGRLGSVTEPAPPRRLEWRVARILETRDETPHARTLVLDVAGWSGHRAGQHVDVRLTAEDGYQAQRSYSIASAPGASALELTIERLDDGEVSPWLAGVAGAGDAFELRGPIGGYFLWHPGLRRPLVFVAGGSGIVPLMAMLRQRAAVRDRHEEAPPVRLLYSARSAGDVIYRAEIDALAGRDDDVRVAYTLTRSQPPGWTGYGRRIDRAMLDECTWQPAESPLIYVCGPTPMVERTATDLVALGHEPMAIRTERFGPSGTT